MKLYHGENQLILKNGLRFFIVLLISIFYESLENHLL